jgi:hypothetical protein
MPDDTPPTPPGGWSWSACSGILCPPGAKAVTVTISDCASSAQIGVLTPFIVTDATGTMATSTQGVALICCVVPGYSFTVSYQGYQTKNHTLTQDEVNAQSAHICLDKKPPPPPPPPTCPVFTLMRSADFEPTAQVLAPFYRIRDMLAATPRGEKLVALYYDPDTKERVDRALQNSAELRTEGLSLVLELQPALARAQRPGLPGVGVGSCDCDEGVLLTEDVQRRGARFLDVLEAESGASELIGLVRGLAQVADQGLRAVERWLTGVSGEGDGAGDRG